MPETTTDSTDLRLFESKLESDIEYTRQQLVRRARSLAGDLTRLADGLEQDVNHGFNTLGELQGNGVELDAWCVKLAFGRDTLKLFKEAKAEKEDGDAN